MDEICIYITNSSHDIPIEDGKYIFNSNNEIKLISRIDGSVVFIPINNMFKTVFGYQKYEDAIKQLVQDERKYEKKWSRNAILQLIHLYKEFERDFIGSTQKNEKVWVLLANEMAKNKFLYDATQCKNKFKYLKQKYLKKRDNMSSKASGAAPIFFEFFEEFNEIFDKRPIVNPVVRSNLQPVEEMNAVTNVLEEDEGTSEDDLTANKKRKIGSGLDKLVSFLKDDSHIREQNRQKKTRRSDAT